MLEKELISKIESLKEIKPNENWALLAKNEIFDSKDRVLFTFPVINLLTRSSITAFASLGFIALIFVSAQGAFLGDTLYPVKRITEKARIFFVSQENRQDFNLQLTNKRLEEISEIVRKNQIKTLSLAVKELETMKFEMQKDFARLIESKPRKEVVEIAKNFGPTLLEIEDQKDLLLGPLGVRVEDSGDSLSAIKDSAIFLIEDLEGRSLTKEEELLLEKAKKFLSEENYSSALRTVLKIGQPVSDDIEIEEIEEIIEIEEEN